MADTLSCQWETLHSQKLRSIKKSIDSDHLYLFPQRLGTPLLGPSEPRWAAHRHAGQRRATDALAFSGGSTR
jgi:hypothetical protein